VAKGPQNAAKYLPMFRTRKTAGGHETLDLYRK
jgi:hypothetical protein